MSLKLTTFTELLIDELVSAAFDSGRASAESDGEGIDTTDVDDARKALIEHFTARQEHPLLTLGEAEDSCNGDDEFCAIVHFDAGMNLIVEPRSYANYEGGVCTCCGCGDTVDKAEKDDEQMVVNLSLWVDEREPVIEALRERVEKRRRAERAEHAHQVAETREAVTRRATPVLDTLKARKEAKKECALKALLLK